jgi:prevent-host-death family protein
MEYASLESPMATIRPTEDIQPLTAFRANAASFVEHVRSTGRPLVLTQHGRSSAVLIGAAEYESLVEELETLRDIHVSERQIAEGDVIANEDARGRILEFIEARISE